MALNVPFISLSIILIILVIVDILLTRKIIKLDGLALSCVTRKFGLYRPVIILLGLTILAAYILHWAILIPVNILQAGKTTWSYYYFKKTTNGF